MKQNNHLPYPIGSFLFSLVFIICGMTQIVAGITFLIMFKLKILWTASNIWIGFLNAISGSAWMKISSKKKLGLNIGICLGLTIWNVANWLLMELGEWRSFFPENFLLIRDKDAIINLITAAYFSTMIPTVIAFVVALLACQFFSALLIIQTAKKKSEKINPNQFQHSTQQTTFKWVYDESCSVTPCRLQITQASVHNTDNTCLENDPNSPRLFVHHFSEITEAEGRQSENDTNFTSANEETEPVCSGVRFASNQEIAISSRNGSTSHTLFRTATIHRRPALSSLYSGLPEEIYSINGSESRNLSEIPSTSCTDRFCTREVSVAQARSVTQVVPTDVDTLIHLTQMELLARQWRFQSQYKALERKVSLRLARPNSVEA